MRRRPLLRAAAVGGGAYLAGKQRARRQTEQQSQDAGQDQRISNLEQQATATQPEAGAPAAAPSMGDQLNQLADLHNQGVLSDDEFAAAKSKLLGA
ncbi:MAG TPA: SHOCT domain-containing protein [Trebonia sp.]